MVLCICVSPVYADTDSGATFKSWVNAFLDTTSPLYHFWHELFGDDASDTAYTDYVATLPVTNINSSGLSTFYIDGWEYSGSSFTISSSSSESPSLSGYCGSTSATYVLMHSGYFSVPTTGTYDLYVSACTALNTYSSSAIFYLYSYSDGAYSPVTPVGGTGSDGTYSSSYTSILSATNTRYFRCSLTAGVQYVVSTGTSAPLSGSGFAFKPSSVSDLCSFSCSMCISGLNYSTSTNYDYSSDTRAGAITGDYVSVDGDVYNDCTIFNETTNTYTNPSTGTTTAISTWTYDYATRTYSLYDADGNLITVAYQDQQLVITSGGTTADYSYASDSGGSSSGGDSGGSSSGTTIGGLIETLLSGVGDIVGGIVKGVLQILIKAVDALKGIGDLFNSLVATVVSLFGDFTSFLSAVFPFLPDEFGTILNLGFILLIAAVVIKKIVG